MLAEIGGVGINYEISGTEGMPWLTFSNSLATNLGMWDEQAEALAGEFRILRYDKRGHGGSQPVEGPYSFDDLIGDVVGLWDHLGVERSFFVGLSIGGMTAQGLLLKHADRVVATVMANTMALCRQEFVAAWEDRVAAVSGKGMGAVLQPTMERWFTEGYRATDAPRLDDVRRMILDTSVAGYCGCARAIQELAYLDRLGTLDHPVLLIAGAHDAGTPPSGMRLMHERIQGSEYVELDAAHISNIEKADAFTAAAREFLGSHAG